MNNENNPIRFSQYVFIPLLGEAWAERDRALMDWLPFFQMDTRYVGDTLGSDDEWVNGDGAIRSITFRAGRWHISICRAARIEAVDPEAKMKAWPEPSKSMDQPVMWNQTAWLCLAAPVLFAVAIPTMFVTSLFSHLIGSRLRRQLSWR